MLTLPDGLDLDRTLGLLRYGSGDPAFMRTPEGIWRASLTPEGPVSICITQRRGDVEVRAWGSGAEWIVANLSAMFGLDDDDSTFRPDTEPIRDLYRRIGRVHFPRTELIFESLVPAILSQKITGKEAFGSWRMLLHKYGGVAPGPVPDRLRVPPSPAQVRALADWDWHQLGVDRAHRETIRRAAGAANSLDRLTTLPADEAIAKLMSIRGIGLWTASEVAQRALGAADAPSFGDYHVPSTVGYAFTGEPTDDEGMARLLAPYRPHRGRVVRLLELARVGPPRRGPRRTVPDYRRF
ncbi:3-methyladenine DNA glycosylase/8-oxoguanine DNA glycosylase [Antricoccus suffuscus]|uniref:3-methyladenine DNA glycosylase/8-oxoguanine DNA glycosylase n=1 Tax=Antricoccus suffuscus TaxID=1629062 RepID=A0A2T0ZQP4_9ACTN|nr:3-methyladenine DNA glycosylase/8-oxoguanine DNA glycosylase [Antricoccus suffuscus]